MDLELVRDDVEACQPCRLLMEIWKSKSRNIQWKKVSTTQHRLMTIDCIELPSLPQ
jgi:hypothetical protein